MKTTGSNPVDMPRSGSQAVERAIAVLACFEGGESHLTVSSLARRTGLAVSTTYRIAQALVRGGLLERDDRTEGYRVGSGLVSLAVPPLARLGADFFAPHLYSLAAEIKLTASLGIANNEDAVTVFSAGVSEQCWANRLPRPRQPLRSSAMGLAILAYRNHGAVQMKSSMPGTELERVRRYGYASSFDADDREVLAVAVPLLDPRGHSWGAVGVQGLRRQLTDTLVREIVPAMKVAATRIGPGPAPSASR